MHIDCYHLKFLGDNYYAVKYPTLRNEKEFDLHNNQVKRNYIIFTQFFIQQKQRQIKESVVRWLII